MPQKVEEIIRQKLAQGLQPSVLEIKNESHLHSGHAGDNGSGESHFRVTVVAQAFNGKNRVARQRMVYDLLASEMEQLIHALALKTISADEYNGV